MNRRKARETVFCLIFDLGFHPGEKPEELLELYLEHFLGGDNGDLAEKIRADEYIAQVYFGVSEQAQSLDQIIQAHSSNWKITRVSRISLSILRIALYEMLYHKEIPVEVCINEAVELAKKYDHDDGYTFVNGVLGAVEKSQKSDG